MFIKYIYIYIYIYVYIYIDRYRYVYIYIYVYMLHTLFAHFEKEAILMEGTNQPRMKLLFWGEEVLIKKVFHITHKENTKKTKEVLRKPGKLWLPV